MGTDILELLSKDVDDVVDWAYKIKTQNLDSTLCSLLDVLKDNTQQRIIHARATSAIQALPPHDRQPDPKDMWSKDTVENTLDVLSDLFFKSEDGTMRDNYSQTIHHVLYYRLLLRKK